MSSQDFDRDATPLRGPAPPAEPAPLTRTLYRELRALAGHYLRMERPGHTLQPTALVSEAFLRLRDQVGDGIKNRRDFVALAAVIMRRVLVDHARAAKALKRGGAAGARVGLEAEDISASPTVDLLALDEAIERLARLDPRHARVVEMRFFGGLSVAQTAEILDVSHRTVEADWQLARAWLRRELGPEGAGLAPSTRREHPRCAQPGSAPEPPS